MSDLDLFEVFVEVADREGITAAALSMGVSKASVSKQIKLLEQRYNITVFTRYKQRLQLTPEGEQLLKQCRHLKRELDEVRCLCRGLQEEPQGRLHVVVFPYFARHWVIPRLAEFSALYPKLELHLDTNERIPDFYGEQVNLAMGYSLPLANTDEVVQRRMATTRYLLCASPEYFAKFGKPKTTDDLHHHCYIEHVGRESNRRLKLKRNDPVVLKPSLYLNSVSAMIDCAKQGLGLVQLPLYMLQREIAAGSLVEVLADLQAVDQGVYYYYPKLSTMRPKVRAFIDHFISPQISH